MITQHRIFSLRDFSNRGNDVSVEVNWNKTALIKDGEYIKIKIGDTEGLIKKEHLWTIVFMISDESQQERMVPIQLTETKNYDTIVRVKSKKDIKAGQIFEMPMSVSINKETGAMTIKP